MLRFFASVLLVLASVAAYGAPVSDSPALQVFRQWLDAFNSGEAAKVTAFWQKYGAAGAESRTQDDLRLRQMTGGMKILKVTEDSGTHLVALMQEANGGYSESTLDLASTDPPVVKGIRGHPVPPPGGSNSAAASRLRRVSVDRDTHGTRPDHTGKLALPAARG